MEILLGAVAWFVFGLLGFIYWWTKELSLDVGDLVFGSIFVAWLGPLSWIGGYFIHGKESQTQVIIMRARK